MRSVSLAMDKEKFLARLIPVPESGCMLWDGAGTRYGLCYTGNKQYSKGQETTHRVSFKLFKGDIPEGFLVLHKCDVPLCCNPDHLFLGTAKDNNLDCKEKGRNNNGNRHLTESQIKEMRVLREKGQQVKAIAEMFNIDRGYCSRLVKGCQPKGAVKCHG